MAAKSELADWAERGIDALSGADPCLPEALRRDPEAPSLVFLRGRLEPADADAVAVVGTRTPTRSGAAAAATLADGLTRAGRTVISGLAAGIDGAAHRGALAAGGRTIAVLGNGFDHAYPREHAELQRAVSCLVSAYAPDVPPHPERFRQRNRLMAALARAAVIVEAGPRSGVRILARHALELGRPVVLFERVLVNDWARELSTRSEVTVVADTAEALDVLAR